MKFYITGSLFFSIFNFVILRVLGAFEVQILFLTALFGIKNLVALRLKSINNSIIRRVSENITIII